MFGHERDGDQDEADSGRESPASKLGSFLWVGLQQYQTRGPAN